MDNLTVKRVIGNIVGMILQLFAAIIGIILISALPFLFKGMSIDFSQYRLMVTQTVNRLLNIQELTYQDKFRDWPILSHVFKYYQESMAIFFTAFILSLFLAVVIVYILISIKPKWYKGMKYIFALFESIPDLLIILALQIFVIWFFKKTGYLLFEIATVGDIKSFGLPVLALSFSSTFLFIKLLLAQIETEQSADYVEFAKSKGFSMIYILNRHISRNIFFTVFHYSKTIVLFMLSGLFIVELLFNVNGLFNFLQRASIPEVFVISLLYLYVPFFVLFKLYDFFIPAALKGEKTI